MSRQSVALLKGLGILLIITHNYMHWLPECVSENEYTFSIERINLLVEYVEQGGPHLLFNILSHFGHYGVAIFLFVSGYGLTKKYELSPVGTDAGEGSKKPGLFRFLWRHALKLWKLMVPAVLIFVAIELYLGSWNRPWSRLVPLLGFYSNLQVERDLILGPWWWFGLMAQFYVLWRLFICGRGKWVLYTIMAVCLGGQIALTWLQRGDLTSQTSLIYYLHYNFPCSMLAFGLGVAHARYGLSWLTQWWSPVVGMLLLIFGAFNAGIWCISSVGMIMMALALVNNPEGDDVRPHHYITWRSVLVFFGNISAWLFALHPVVRQYTIKMAKTNQDADVYLSVFLYLLISVLVSWAFWALTRKKHPFPHNKPAG